MNSNSNFKLSETNWYLFIDDLAPDKITFDDAIMFGAEMYKLGYEAGKEIVLNDGNTENNRTSHVAWQPQNVES